MWSEQVIGGLEIDKKQKAEAQDRTSAIAIIPDKACKLIPQLRHGS